MNFRQKSCKFKEFENLCGHSIKYISYKQYFFVEIGEGLKLKWGKQMQNMIAARCDGGGGEIGDDCCSFESCDSQLHLVVSRPRQVEDSVFRLPS